MVESKSRVYRGDPNNEGMGKKFEKVQNNNFWFTKLKTINQKK